MVMVNVPTAGVDFHVPFGGRKGSSYGPKEQGRYAARVLHPGEDRLHRRRLTAVRLRSGRRKQRPDQNCPVHDLGRDFPPFTHAPFKGHGWYDPSEM